MLYNCIFVCQAKSRVLSSWHLLPGLAAVGFVPWTVVIHTPSSHSIWDLGMTGQPPPQQELALSDERAESSPWFGSFVTTCCAGKG